MNIKNNNNIIYSRIKLYLYFVICFVLSVIIRDMAINNGLQINSMFIFVISLVIISLYLLEKFATKKILLDSYDSSNENIVKEIDVNEASQANLTMPQDISYKTDNIKLQQGFNDLSDEFKILRQEIETKDKEIERYRDGYDASKLKNYFSKFTDLDSLIKEYTAENYIDLKGLKDIQDQMNEALAEYDIEIFYPPLQEDYSSSKGISDVTKRNRIKTMDKEQHFKIAEVISPGYRRKIDHNLATEEDSNYQIISNAVVSIYVFDSSDVTK